MTLETRGFSRVAAAFSSYDGDLSLPLGLALGDVRKLLVARGTELTLVEGLPWSGCIPYAFPFKLGSGPTW